MSAQRASLVFVCDSDPDLTVGAIFFRTFGPDIESHQTLARQRVVRGALQGVEREFEKASDLNLTLPVVAQPGGPELPQAL